jgi:hypothetical protein
MSRYWLAFLLLLLVTGCRVDAKISTNSGGDGEKAQREYVRSHRCKFVNHVSLDEIHRFSPSTSRIIDGKLETFGNVLTEGYSQYDCNGVTAYVDDVDGKPWHP